MNMLNHNCKTSFVKHEFLKKAQRPDPRMYDIGCYNDNLALMLAPESDEMIRKPATFSDSLTKKDFLKSKSVTINNVSNDLSKPVTAQILPQDVNTVQKNTNVIAPGMYRVHTRPNQTRTTQLPQDIRKTNKHVSFSTGVIPTTSVSRLQLESNRLEDRVMHNNSQGKKQEVEDHRRNFKFSNNKTPVTACNDSLNVKTSNVKFVCVTCGKCVLNDNHDLCVLYYINGVNSRTKKPTDVPISTRKPKRNVNQSVTTPPKKIVASESSNQKPRSTIRKQYEYVSKTSHRDNSVHRRLWVLIAHDEKSQASKDLVQGNVTIKRVYYVEGIHHNLFSVGQFCDADLEVAFRKSTCYIRDLKGNDLLTGSCGTDLYSITLQNTTSPNLICLMAKASSSQAWLWHRRLSHLNFDTINLLSKYDIVTGLPKLKFVKDHLCSSCELGKAKRKSFKTKPTPSSKRQLQILHMDLCGPMRVERFNDRTLARKVLRKDFDVSHPTQSTVGGKYLASISLGAELPLFRTALKGWTSTELYCGRPYPRSSKGATAAGGPEPDPTSPTMVMSPGSIYQPEWGVTNGYRLDTPSSCQELVDHLAPPVYFSELRHLPNEDFLGQFNMTLAWKVAMGSQLQLRFEQEAKLLRISVAQVACQDQRIQAMEGEKKNMETLLEAEADMRKAAEAKNAELVKEMESLHAQFTKLQVSRDGLSYQVSTLSAQVTGEEKIKATFEEFKKYEDERVSARCAEMDSRLDALSIDFDEELYPHMLTAIAGRRWVIGHGLRLAVLKCAESLKLRQTFANVVSAGIIKGFCDGLKYGVE
ncbi:retrovirus-related pol polyprotein from transposon TNT 1-94 [Tanacetum coccineum]|uniref:Retrovirus-related pol polyprotein from transposon TNT 1-94 n=1 Tax=Tanacetum coccineum TaxID=301880 RepID=A0ABQ5HF46_9ASTR